MISAGPLFTALDGHREIMPCGVSDDRVQEPDDLGGIHIEDEDDAYDRQRQEEHDNTAKRITDDIVKKIPDLSGQVL